MISFSQLEAITGGKVLQQIADRPVKLLSLDSRKISVAEGSLFFAIAGQRHDGHQHLKQVYQSGVQQFVVEKKLNAADFPQANILLVDNTVDALQKIAAHHRSQFNLEVIGITGSNGKTIIKEWLYQILSKYYPIAKNPGSYNSQVGVPLSVWSIQSYHKLAIFEAGISKPDEMEKLRSVIQPTLGVFTNVGPAHDEGFTSRQQKILEKLKLFEHVSCLIYCKDHEEIDVEVSNRKLISFTWGKSTSADVVVAHKGEADYTATHQGTSFSFRLPFSDPASAENALHCMAVMLKLGLHRDAIQEGINQLRAIPMRLELKEGINHCQIIDDTYNNDLAGLEISLQFLAHQHQRARKSLILSDIKESGLDEKSSSEQIASLIQKHALFRFIGIGPAMTRYQGFFPEKSVFYENTQDFMNTFNVEDFSDEIILVKGARKFEFEKIVNRLQRKVHGTIMEIDMGALVHNLNYFRSKLKPTTKLMVMVKAFAYGSGSNEIANVLQYHRVDYLGVAYPDEGVDLRKNNITLPIMVMNPSEESFDSLLQFDLEPEIYSFKILRTFLQYLRGRSHRIHLKLDTGMHRLGFEEHDLAELTNTLKENKNLIVASIFSHLAGADEQEHDAFSSQQATRFTQWADRLSAAIGYKPLYHILNSPGILRLADWQQDMVRLGIGLYGIDPTREGFNQLKPIATLKTIISQIKRIPKGESIGYGRKGVAKQDTVIATLAIGYADGFSRAFSNGKGQVLIQGKLAPVIGNVCMDMTMVDITGIDAHEGDEVTVFGSGLPIQEIAGRIQTISYEILTNTSERVKRVFVSEGI